MPQVDLESFVCGVAGAGAGDRKVSCETVIAGESGDASPPRMPPPDPDFPPESITIPIGDEVAFSELNPIYDRDDSTKGSTNPKSAAGASNGPIPAKSRSNSTRIAGAPAAERQGGRRGGTSVAQGVLHWQGGGGRHRHATKKVALDEDRDGDDEKQPGIAAMRRFKSGRRTASWVEEAIAAAEAAGEEEEEEEEQQQQDDAKTQDEKAERHDTEQWAPRLGWTRVAVMQTVDSLWG
uniref:Uncharacterized protein n=1 Tax=Oryza brachyantha TaxID=4533 RepID=J3L629_ORYBR